MNSDLIIKHCDWCNCKLSSIMWVTAYDVTKKRNVDICVNCWKDKQQKEKENSQ
jgi:hypothetical protein